MPRYNWNISDLLSEADAMRMIRVARTKREVFLVSLLWLTGARTGEICGLPNKGISGLRKKDIEFDDYILTIKLYTLKRGKSSKFQYRHRHLRFKREQGLNRSLFMDSIIKYAAMFDHGDDRLFPYSTRLLLDIINKLGVSALEKPICPYHFRHSVMTYLATAGYNQLELMYFKGSTSPNSVAPYLHARPFLVSIDRDHDIHPDPASRPYKTILPDIDELVEFARDNKETSKKVTKSNLELKKTSDNATKPNPMDMFN